MTTLIYCALAMMLLPYLAKIPVAIYQQKAGGYDNHMPRQQQASLTGLGARALAAHQNTFEAAIMFAIAFAVAVATQNTGGTIQGLFIGFIVLRVLYCVLYWLDVSTLRSIVWGLALGCLLVVVGLSL
ncbi:MAPEG family protein [Pseudoalteromonas xiamenensis]|jgi:uncharacterized MAPEG superfamily protein|uniref:MAPEG family protein n=1 Tax=Pseudoalteromonas xiamenensis TaxID=882626 RepID=A0A975DEA7_9GAMM|nr:MAPEG family protein [Pseudoalteromonas xiamenensis]QTH70246.1 MAPEG family protein [Pseudoalteromonas xiamenensis]